MHAAGCGGGFNPWPATWVLPTCLSSLTLCRCAGSVVCCSYIGYRPGDPTAGPPPAAMPAPAVEPAAGSKVIDLREMSMAQLMAEAATTHSRDFFAALLPNPPGTIDAVQHGQPTVLLPAALGRHGLAGMGSHRCRAALLPRVGPQQPACNPNFMFTCLLQGCH